jgi:transcriptional regulator with XRE-family HTH domain
VPPKKKLSQLLRELRKRLGLTQEKFAAKLGVTLPTICRWENDRTKPSPLALRQVESLIESLGKDSSEFLKKYFPEE